MMEGWLIFHAEIKDKKGSQITEGTRILTEEYNTITPLDITSWFVCAVCK